MIARAIRLVVGFTPTIYPPPNPSEDAAMPSRVRQSFFAASPNCCDGADLDCRGPHHRDRCGPHDGTGNPALTLMEPVPVDSRLDLKVPVSLPQ